MCLLHNSVLLISTLLSETALPLSTASKGSVTCIWTSFSQSLWFGVPSEWQSSSTDSIIIHNTCLCKTLQSSSVSLNSSSIFSTCMFTSNICMSNVYKKQLQWGWVKSHYVEMRWDKWCNFPYTKDFRNHIFAIMGCAYARRKVYKDSNASHLNFPTVDKLFLGKN